MTMQGLLTTKQAAAWLGISVRKFVTLGIRRVLIGRSVRYDPRDLVTYADTHGSRPAMRQSA
jgi:hypothetical protein